MVVWGNFKQMLTHHIMGLLVEEEDHKSEGKVNKIRLNFNSFRPFSYWNGDILKKDSQTTRFQRTSWKWNCKKISKLTDRDGVGRVGEKRVELILCSVYGNEFAFWPFTPWRRRRPGSRPWKSTADPFNLPWIVRNAADLIEKNLAWKRTNQLFEFVCCGISRHVLYS